MEYADFLQAKAQIGSKDGLEPLWMPDYLFDFQRSMVDWSLRQGRAAIFEDCGMGKTPQELVWAENVVRKTNGKVLLLTFLAVGAQMVQEAEKFGVQVTRSHDGMAYPGITIANYERLHYFNPADFVGIVCDESSILKSFDGRTRQAVTDFARKMRYRLLATATAAPNDYVELGTSSEEGDLLEKLIPDAVQVSGKDSDDAKEERLMAFAAGKARVLITKPKIGAWGLNFQHCNHVTVFPSHSFEQYYQGIRRCWRFGQKRPVRVDIVTTEGERGVLRNLQRKAGQADAMFSALVAEMNDVLTIDRIATFGNKLEVPSWLTTA